MSSEQAEIESDITDSDTTDSYHVSSTTDDVLSKNKGNNIMQYFTIV